ncbi:hypothetical protein HHK36_004783 [Tetracentron sinense]|uniref:Myb/SANT-like domain-containing protein n=1 Tax=Tetracentron sinense TaxID=13715 RepID=A0A835DLV3_TETSI|nr:hypothetical protein HHK36_004783 [Tetracentron sinense]
MSSNESGRANWSNEVKKTYIDLCIEQVHLGNRPGSTLKPAAWKKVVKEFNLKTGLNYDQRQLKSRWDAMRKKYAEWVKLSSLTGIGYNATTHRITMDDKRWEEHLKVNPDARVFRTNSLQFPEDMVTLFGGRAATGSAAWAPSSMSLPDDTSQQSLESHTPSLGEYNTSVDTQHDGGDDVGLEERMNDLRRKRPCLSRNRKETRGDALRSDIQRVITNLEEARKSTAPSIAVCFESLNAMVEIEDGGKLYIAALNCFRVKENREIWMLLEKKNVARIEWLKENLGSASS